MGAGGGRRGHESNAIDFDIVKIMVECQGFNGERGVCVDVSRESEWCWV